MNTLMINGYSPIQIQDRQLFSSYFKKMNGAWASSISFTSILAWNHSIEIYSRVIGEYLSCIAEDKTEKRWVFLPPIGRYAKESIGDCIGSMRETARELEIPFIITDVSEWMLEYLMDAGEVRLEASYEENLSDYIYTMEDFRNSMDSQKTRYNYRYFIRNYNPIVVDVDLCLEEIISRLEETWCTFHDCSYCSYGCLLDTARNIIGCTKEAGAHGIAVLVDGKMEGYCIVSKEKDQLFFHFKKCFGKFRGLDEFLHSKCIELFAGNAAYVNYTEDMGIEGLRYYKRRLARYTLMHKYELREVGDSFSFLE